MSTSEQSNFLTIIIPTRERSDTLVHTINNALAQDYDHFEVLVSDNASLDQTQEKVEELKDSRVRYINTGRRVSMSENWEFALDHISHGWITVLGDDDGILPGSLKYVNELINKTGVDAVRSNGCSYSWPSLRRESYGRLLVSSRRGFEIRNSGTYLQKVIDGNMSYTELPVLYNGGFISYELVKQAKQVTGQFFCSMTPDVYSGIVFSFLTEKYLYSYEPLAINGASIHSGGTAGFEKIKRERDYDPAEKFFSEPNLPFHKDLPLTSAGRPVKSIPAIVYEAYLQAHLFHSQKSISTSRSKQLLSALIQSGPDKREILEWAKLFSDKHEIVLPRRSFILLKSIMKKIHTFPVRVMTSFGFSRLVGCDRVPLKNIYEASIVAGAIKELQPSLLQRSKSLLRRILRS